LPVTEENAVGLLTVGRDLNPLTPKDYYSGRTAPLTSKVAFYIFIQRIYDTEYFKHGVYSPSFPLQNTVCFIILTYLVPVLFTFYIQGVLKLKKNNNSGAKRLNTRYDVGGKQMYPVTVRNSSFTNTGHHL